jgi:hypothetical protein
MPNPQHVDILGQGAAAWNEWRVRNAGILPDLQGADLRKRSLRNYDLSNCNLAFADARDVSFRRANLTGATLESAKLYRAFFSGTDLSGARFRKAILYETVFANVDLSKVSDLESCRHKGPSVVDHRTLARSPALPQQFLRGCGLPDVLIKEVRREDSAIRQYWSCFISYSGQDGDFVKRFYDDLQSRGVRCWYAPSSMKVGGKIRDAIDEAIRESGKVLLVLSSNSLGSRWVEKEFETTLEEEQRRGRSVLIPIRLDDSPWTSSKSWVADIRRSLNIGDFSSWRDSRSYEEALSRLLDALARKGEA